MPECSRPLDEGARSEWTVRLHHALPAASVVLVVTGCAAPDSPRYEAPVEGGVLVRVVDEEGRPVAGAEVRSPRDGYDPMAVAEHLFANTLGRADRFGATWLTDARGEVRVSARARVEPVVARSGDRWGVSLAEHDVEPDESGARTIVVARDESIRVMCRDRDGQPGLDHLDRFQIDSHRSNLRQRGLHDVNGRDCP